MATEFELKYRASAEILEKIQSACPGEYTAIPMTTTYYDALDGSLSAKRWTLRHRREGERQVCTLKTPGAGGARGEWEVDCPGIFEALPKLESLSGRALPRTLKATCGAEFTRLAAMREGEGFTAELALDKGILLNGEKRAEFAEVELELKSGSRDALAAFGAEFARRFGLETEPKSKFARARALGQEG